VRPSQLCPKIGSLTSTTGVMGDFFARLSQQKDGGGSHSIFRRVKTVRITNVSEKV
jgi:hypothetical protein